MANQSEYSLLHRKPEDELVPAVEDAGLGLMAWGPLGRGVLSGKYRGQIPSELRAAEGRLSGYVEKYLDARGARVVGPAAVRRLPRT